MTTALPPGRPVAHAVRWLRVVLLLVMVTGFGGLVALLIAPAQPTMEETDVIVVLAGGEGERLRTALDLVEAGFSDTLAISNGNRHGWVRANQLCESSGPPDVICFDPRPGSTAGEARAVAGLSRRNGWDHVTVVTSDYHVLRSRLGFSQCLDGELVMVPAGVGPMDLPGSVRSLLREMAALPAMMTVARAC